LNSLYHIPFHKPTYTKQDLASVEQAFVAENWSKDNEEAKEFFRQYYPNSLTLFTNSCSSALEMAIRVLELKADDEVIIPAFGYVAVANAVVNNGAVPVFADVDPKSGNIDIKSIEACITNRTKAVIAIHYAGNPIDIEGLQKLCRGAGIFFIEDAAQCIGSSYNHQPLGSFGHLACLSFDYMKNVSCGQGGLLIVNDKNLLSKVQTAYDNGTNRFALLNGTQKYFEWVSKGNNYRINPIASHFLNGQLKGLKQITEDRLRSWRLYYELLFPLQAKGQLTLPENRNCHNGHIFFLVTSSADVRNELRNYLRERGIFSEHHYTSLAHSAYGMQFAHNNNSVQLSERLCHQLLRLPLWYQMTEDDVRKVVEVISSFYSK